jgi:hypothetical protein
MSHKGGKHGRAHSKASRQRRRQEALERDAACAALTPKERLANLDKRYGPGMGAKRERARLALWLKDPRRAAAAQASRTHGRTVALGEVSAEARQAD